MTPGSALSGQFMFSTATVCVAPQGSVKAINPSVHSIGLTKNVRVDASPTNIDLTQGIRQDVVASVTNRMAVTAGFEVYELTTKNLAYGLGLDGSGLVVAADAIGVSGPVAAAATTIPTDTDGSAVFTTGKWAFIQENLDDQIYIFKVASSTSSAVTMAAGYAVPALMNFTSNARVGVINKLDADPSQAQGKYFTVQIIGTSIKDQRPLVITFPKARISKGFGMAFSDSNFGNLPFEITPMVPLPSDTGYDGDFKQLMSVMAP
jgi:hypothetical protein